MSLGSHDHGGQRAQRRSRELLFELLVTRSSSMAHVVYSFWMKRLLFESGGTCDDFDELSGDHCLAFAIVLQGEFAEHLGSIR
jgi:hypothetical protein